MPMGPGQQRKYNLHFEKGNLFHVLKNFEAFHCRYDRPWRLDPDKPRSALQQQGLALYGWGAMRRRFPLRTKALAM